VSERPITEPIEIQMEIDRLCRAIGSWSKASIPDMRDVLRSALGVDKEKE
jgi:hypothetical protein